MMQAHLLCVSLQVNSAGFEEMPFSTHKMTIGGSMKFGASRHCRVRISSAL
jgi:hypothetical protein